jgi:stearoyl-CoA desaturase (delta-9 desaturase)
MCTTIYLHRAITHRGLDLHPAVAFLMHLELLLFTGVKPREWAAVHRKHHHFSDREGDPHSPYLLGMWTVLFCNYYFYKKECDNRTTVYKYTPDYREDWLDRLPFARYGHLLGLGIFMLVFGWLLGAAAWAIHVALYLLLTAAVNSLGHGIGYRNFDNKATNLRWLAWLTGGEGLHNNHHEYPTSSRFALKRTEFDPAWPLIRLMELLRLAKAKPEPLAKAA